MLRSLFVYGGIFINIFLVAVNAKFIHSSLALRSIKEYCLKYGNNVYIEEFTINNDLGFIVNEIYDRKPDVLGFSCYIWNIELILKIVSDIKKILPNVKIILGGPEVSYEFEHLFPQYVDIVAIGEGEQTIKEICDYFDGKIKSLYHIDGIAFWDFGKIVTTKKRTPLQLDEIPFVYYNSIDELDNRIIYYEASRGCPYMCQYCLSSVEKGVRFLSLERVFSDIKFFLEHNVKQVKFVDRTFNCNKSFAVAIWNFIIQNDNGVTNFHFEISADIIDEEMLEVFSRARPKLFQLEIGVQSTNERTLNDIKRKTDLEKLFEKVKQIKKMNNIHQHLDLIAGLPDENYNSFKKSFNDVFSLYPEQFQLGFLKLLRGSGLRRNSEKLGIVYRENAPYEVLFTKELSFAEISLIKLIEEMVESYYNSGKAVYTIRYLINFFNSPFQFFETLAFFWKKRGYYKVAHSKMELYNILYLFSLEYVKEEIDKVVDVIKFDIFLNDNIKSFPDWIPEENKEAIREFSKEFYFNEKNIERFLPHLKEYSPKQLMRMCHIEKFDFDICSWIENGFENFEKNLVFILFDYYGERNLTGDVIYMRVGGNNESIKK